MSAAIVVRYRIMASVVAVALVLFLIALPRFLQKSTKAASPSPARAASIVPLEVDNSCSARNCHGGVVPRFPNDVRQNEYTIWSAADRHAKALDSLSNDVAKSISLHLAKPGTAPIPADKDPRCLACHSTPTSTGRDVKEVAWDSSGVGCEACHGRSDSWRNEHYAWRDMLERDKASDMDAELAKQYAKHGMIWLGDDLARAKACVGCHVGAPATEGGKSSEGVPLRDVNHDLIAAGHPRLQFDLNSFLAAMPPHWTEMKRGENTHLKLWAAGQWAALEAWLKLLRNRATSAGGGDWPELAELRCFSCHHDLAPNAWRQHSYAASAGTPGQFQWGNYYYSSLVDASAVLFPGIDLSQLPGDWKQLTAALQSPSTKPSEIAERAGAVLTWMESIEKQGASKKTPPIDIEAFRDRLMARLKGALAEPNKSMDWDEAAQLFIELKALAEDGHLSPAQIASTQKLRSLLAFPDDGLSPSSFDPEKKEFRSTIQSLTNPN